MLSLFFSSNKKYFFARFSDLFHGSSSFIDFSYRGGGQALSYPVELGGFANYNKTQVPLELSLTLGLQGSESDFEHALARLDEYRREAVKLTVATPATIYHDMTLTGCDYSRSRESGAGLLIVKLILVEVREARTEHSRSERRVISKPKNPTSADPIKVGRVQAMEVADNIMPSRPLPLLLDQGLDLMHRPGSWSQGVSGLANQTNRSLDAINQAGRDLNAANPITKI